MRYLRTSQQGSKIFNWRRHSGGDIATAKSRKALLDEPRMPEEEQNEGPNDLLNSSDPARLRQISKQ